MAAPKRQLTAFERTIPDYRKRILLSLGEALILPPVITVFFLRTFLGGLSTGLTSLLAVLSIPAAVVARSQYTLWAQDGEAGRLGAKPITRVQGKWPGNVDVVMRLMKSFENGYVLQGFADLFEEYQCTTINTRIFWDDQVISMDEDVVRFVSTTGFQHFEKGVLWHERIDKLLGTGLFNIDGELWIRGRAMARPFFAKERISDFEIFEQTSRKALDLVSQRSSASQPLDMQDLLSRFTLDSASIFLFGMPLDTLSYPLTEPERVKLGPKGSIPIDGGGEFDVFTEAFERVAVLITRRGVQGNTWPLLELFKDKTEEPIEVIMNWIEPLVKKAVEKKKELRRSGVEVDAKDDDTVFLDYLASQTDDVEHIRYELVTYLIASRDTTASLLTFVVYFLAFDPEACARLREEVLETFGQEGAPSYSKLKNMKYLHVVIKETLRLFPSAPLVARSSLDTPLVIPPSSTGANKDALYLPPRTQIMMASLLQHKRHDLWGKDADEFKPARWFDEGAQVKNKETSFMYCPFYGGPRTCIGQDFALNEAGYFIVRLLQRFQAFRLAPEFMPEGSLPPAHWKGMRGRPGVEKILPAINFTMHSKGGLWLFAEESSA